MQSSSTGVLLVNLGTPEAPTPSAVRKYLREFLSDKRVVELPRYVWLPILYFLVLPFRPGKTATKYAAIWKPDPRRATVTIPSRKCVQSVSLDSGIWLDANGANDRWSAH